MRQQRKLSLVEEIKGAVAQEIRIASIGADPVSSPSFVPLPCCLDAEQDLAALLLGGYRTPAELAPLQPRDFYATFFGNVFEAAVAVVERGEVCELDTIAAELEQRGMVGPFRHELTQTRDCTPMVTGLQLRRRVDEVMELSMRRRLIRTMQRVEIAVRVGEIDCDAARAELEQFFFEVLG